MNVFVMLIVDSWGPLLWARSYRPSTCSLAVAIFFFALAQVFRGANLYSAEPVFRKTCIPVFALVQCRR